MKKLIAAAALVLVGALVGAAPAQAGDTRCTGSFGGVADNVIVPSGAECFLIVAQVRGNVLAQPGSGLFLFGATIRGNVEAKGAEFVSTFGSIGGNLKCEECGFFRMRASQVGGNVEIKGGTEGTFIESTDFRGNLEISGRSVGTFASTAAFQLIGTNVGGSFKFEKNSGPTQILGASIVGDLHVVENNVSGTFCPFPGGGGFPFPDCPVVDNGQLLRNDVGGHMQVFKNIGPIAVSENTIEQKLQCKENSPPPTGAGNTARRKEGQCRTL
jgi:hypothetical protein